MHSCKDYTGKEIFSALRDEARNLRIPVLEFSPVVELLLDPTGSVVGAITYNLETGEYKVIRAKATVLATGGFGRVHIQNFPTTNHYGATADGLVIAYRAGAKLLDMDSVQYHPTGVVYPSAILGQLATEKLRSQGAMPVNIDGEAFVYPLEPRDVEAAAIIRECWGREKGIETPSGVRGVWLDTPMIDLIHGEGTIKERLAAMWTMWHRHGIDITHDPVLIYPTLHYQNGGVEIEADGSTNLPGLFAGGEVEGGVHGKNRLMGNSLLGYNVFGKRAGIAAAQWAKQTEIGELSLDHVTRFEHELNEAGIPGEIRAPILLPDYRAESVLARSLGKFL
jgi:succinate dehydrogenase / fumarate reductase flavoprotein subunit